MAKAAWAATLSLKPFSNAFAFNVALLVSVIGPVYSVELVVGNEPSSV